MSGSVKRLRWLQPSRRGRDPTGWYRPQEAWRCSETSESIQTPGRAARDESLVGAGLQSPWSRQVRRSPAVRAECRPSAAEAVTIPANPRPRCRRHRPSRADSPGSNRREEMRRRHSNFSTDCLGPSGCATAVARPFACRSRPDRRERHFRSARSRISVCAVLEWLQLLNPTAPLIKQPSNPVCGR